MADCIRSDALTGLFNSLFQLSENTVLLGGSEEPMYLPALGAKQPAKIMFTRDYVASALHEVAHWCLAGEERRQQADYGYWYRADRNDHQQLDFERAEVRPQALEAVFSQACDLSFRPSYDRLSTPDYRSESFEIEVAAQARIFLQQGLPPRARIFFDELSQLSTPQARTAPVKAAQAKFLLDSEARCG